SPSLALTAPARAAGARSARIGAAPPTRARPGKVPARTSGPITILVDTGRFAGPEAAAAAAESIDWRDDDRADDDASTESFAALELRDFIRRLTGFPADSVRISNAPTLPPAGDVVVIGCAATRAESSWVAKALEAEGSAALWPALGAGPEKGGAGALKTAVPPAIPQGRDGFRIVTAPLGNRHLTLIEGRSRSGALYGAYAFLEAMGVRFDGLGERGTLLPPAPVAMPSRLAIAEQPAFETRGFWAWEDRGDSTFFRWMARNRMNLWTTAQSGH